MKVSFQAYLVRCFHPSIRGKPALLTQDHTPNLPKPPYMSETEAPPKDRLSLTGLPICQRQRLLPDGLSLTNLPTCPTQRLLPDNLSLTSLLACLRQRLLGQSELDKPPYMYERLLQDCLSLTGLHICL